MYNSLMKKKNLTILNAGIAFLVSFILSQFTLAIGISVTESIMSSLGKSSAQIDSFFATSAGYLLKSIYLNIAFIGVFAWYFKSINKDSFVQKPNKSTLKYGIICIIWGVLSFFLLSGMLNHFQWFIEKLGYKSDPNQIIINSIKDLLLYYISLAIIPALCEELLFRGLIINSLKHKGEIFAVVLSSIMFAIFHLSPEQLLYPICWGLLLGIVYLRTKNIIFPMIMHFINNAFSITIQYFMTPSSPTKFEPTVFLAIYAIVTFAIWILVMVYLFKDFIRHNKIKSQNINQKNDSKIDTTQNTSNTSDSNQEYNTYNNLVFYGSIAIMVCIYILLLFA